MTTKSTIHLIAAARPNFMKIAPLYHELTGRSWADPVIVHTGQHYDLNMSDAFFRDLRLPEPPIHLGAGSGSHAEQTARVMVGYEQVLQQTRPHMVVVVGDVNSTMACTIAAVKIRDPKMPLALQRPVIAHLEAGLRSFDRTMPEEVNRIVTDSLADVLWTPSPDGDENLRKEGIAPEKIVRVGNIMIDSLEMLRAPIEAAAVHRELGLPRGEYGVVTLHRPSNVDDPEMLGALCDLLVRLAARLPIAFPIHPRTRKNLEKTGRLTQLAATPGLSLLEPLNYIRFMSLLFDCRLAITDSGGIQEETTYLGVPCMTLRPNTERPITITQGTNQLCTVGDLENLVHRTLSKSGAPHTAPEFWDGRTAGRVADSIRAILEAHAAGAREPQDETAGAAR